MEPANQNQNYAIKTTIYGILPPISVVSAAESGAGGNGAVRNAPSADRGRPEVDQKGCGLFERGGGAPLKCKSVISEYSICWGSPFIKRAHTPSRSWINQAHNKLCSPSDTWGDCRLWVGGRHCLAIMITFCPKQEKTGPTWLSRSCNLSVGAGLSSAWCLCLCRDTHFYLNSSVQEEQVDPGKRRFLFSGGRMCLKRNVRRDENQRRERENLSEEKGGNPAAVLGPPQRSRLSDPADFFFFFKNPPRATRVTVRWSGQRRMVTGLAMPPCGRVGADLCLSGPTALSASREGFMVPNCSPQIFFCWGSSVLSGRSAMT